MGLWGEGMGKEFFAKGANVFNLCSFCVVPCAELPPSLIVRGIT